jgi:hypothetical protein
MSELSPERPSIAAAGAAWAEPVLREPSMISSISSERSTNRHPIYATERARLLFGSFRRGDARSRRS